MGQAAAVRLLDNMALIPFSVSLGTMGTVGRVIGWLVDQLTDILDMSRGFSRITLMPTPICYSTALFSTGHASLVF